MDLTDTPTDNSTTETATTFANKTTNTTPTSIQHQKSAIVTMNQPKQEFEIAKAVYNQMKIKPPAVIQVNNSEPFNYQITFENERQYLQALPQKLQHNNQSYTLQPLAKTRIQISIMRVDAEMDDKDVGIR